jgi:hypothetical protein
MSLTLIPEVTLAPANAQALVGAVVTPAGYPGRIFLVDPSGAQGDAGGQTVLEYNATGDKYVGVLNNGDDVEVRKFGGNWRVFISASDESTGPADSLSPVGSYVGNDDYTVAASASVRGVIEAEPTLSPGAPGSLVAEV